MKNKKIKFTFHPSAIVFFVLILFSAPIRLSIIPLLCALFHELGHIAAARLSSVGVERITVYPFGADMKLSGGGSYLTDTIIALSGPIVNLLLFFIGVRFSLGTLFTVCNLALCGMNLLPIRGLDGGVILRSLLFLILPVRAAEITVRAVTAAFLFLSWLISVYFLFGEGSDPSLFIIVCALFFSSLKKEETDIG